MKKWLGITFLLLKISGYASSFYNEPWLPPLWEFQTLLGFAYERDNRVQTPKGSFNDPANDYMTQFSFAVTPWPDWYVQADLFLTQSRDTDYSYEASFWTVRYLWLDDLNQDPISLTTGIVAYFPSDRFLKNLSFAYHSNINVEFHAVIGKEWACGKEDWITRFWALGGAGIANQGSPWIPFFGAWELRFNDCFNYILYCDMRFGLGNNDIIPDVPFEGYASINHRSIDLGMFLTYELGCFATLVLEGWYNVYAHNFIEHYFGGGINLLIPFGL